MSLASDLDNFFANSDEVIVRNPLKFKERLEIGDRTYGILRAGEHMSSLGEAMGVSIAASDIASTDAVASTFSDSSEILSEIGPGASSVTPLGWVIAAGVISGGAYTGVSHLLESSKDNDRIVVPTYIQTPLDVVAVALIEWMLPLSLKIANAGNHMQQSKLKAIHNCFTDEWGYCSGFVSRLIEEYKDQLDGVFYSALAQSLGTYCAQSKDCDKQKMVSIFVENLHEVIEADGVIHEYERQELDYLSSLLLVEFERSGSSSLVTDVITAASKNLKPCTEITADPGRQSAASSFDSEIRYASKTSGTMVYKAKSLWNALSRIVIRNSGSKRV